jgi:hypothetical protein
VLSAAACAGTPAERAARQGDFAALSSLLVAGERAGEISNAEAARLAHAVAERELRVASGVDAVGRVREVRPCAHELDDALAARMQTHDEAGAQAALARLEEGRLDPDAARAFSADPDPHWRAIAVRTWTSSEDRDLRQRAFLDPEPFVRREAVRAARDAKDPLDLGALSEAARVDPTPIVRTEAVRALALLSSSSSSGVADRLRDLWASGDEALREDIAAAWAGPLLWNAGGREALRWVVASGHGPASVEAAAAVLRHRDASLPGPEETADADLPLMAAARLAEAIESGPRTTRLQALAEAPLDRPDLLAAVERAADDEDLEIRVGALARLAQPGARRRLSELESLARPGSPVAERARFALAASGDRRVQSWVEEDLTAAHAEQRLAAVGALAAMGVAGRGAPLLADGDASVRVRAACTILMAARRR